MSDEEDDIDFYVRQPTRSARRDSGSSSSYSGSYDSRSDDDDGDERRLSVEDEGVQTAKAKAQAKGKGNLSSPHAKRRRSPSLTPPPEPPEMQLKAARQLVRQHLASYRQPTSFSSDEETPSALTSASQSSETMIALDPELARYYRGKDAERVRERAKRQEVERYERRRRQLSLRRSESVGDASTTVDGASTRRAEKGKVKVNGIREEEESDGFEIVPASGVSAQGNGKSTTRAGKERGGGKEVITLSDSDFSRDNYVPIPSNDTHPSSTLARSPSSIDVSGPILNLHLKSRTHSLDVTVRATTKTSRILSHFLESYPDVQTQENVRLVFEGEALHPDKTVQDCELEDDDMVHVLW